MYFCSKKNSGFTLTEMVVTLTIGALILGTVLFSQSKYTDQAALKSAANDISLALRQAQIYGISVKSSVAGQTDFSPSYGLSIDSLGNKTRYVLFTDRNKNTYNDGHFTCDPGSECVEMTTIPRGNQVNKICFLYTNSSTETCNIGRADIYFLRPSTDARFGYIWDNVGYAQIQVPANMKGLRIELISPKGALRSIYIYTTGQISVR